MPITDTILADLTPAQFTAVTHKDGPMLVVAGAGSGKTRVVTRRIAWLLSQGVRPSQILAMTFTNKAAREMRERIASLTGEEPPRSIGTFHSCCARMLRQDITRLNDGRDANFTIYDDGEQLALMKQIFKDYPEHFSSSLQPRAILSLISASKSAKLSPQAFSDSHDVPKPFIQACQLYERKLRECNAVDFDDLLLLMARILEEFPATCDIYRHRYRYLLIDEYQDTNHLQYELMRLLTGPQENVHVTGDPDQSIYSWRGADYSNIMNFTRDFPGAKVVKLEQNYRSTQAILDAANQVISNNEHRLEKNLFTDNASGLPVRCVTVLNGAYEGFYLARQLQQLREEGVSLRDIAVFYRTNSQSRLLEDAFVKQNIPYQLLGGVRFYDRQEIKDLLAFLRLRVNDGDQLALTRALGRTALKIGAKTIAALCLGASEAQTPILHFLNSEDCLKQAGRNASRLKKLADWIRQLKELPAAPVADAVQALLDFSGLNDYYAGQIDGEDRLDNLNEFINKATQFERQQPEATLDDFLQEIALVADVDGHNPDADCVTLMTLHSSKGLEFPHVYIVGVEEGLLPHKNSFDDKTGIEEERRLFYVGITRAQEQLTLIHAQSRLSWDGETMCTPSRFLEELPQKRLKHQTYGITARKRRYY